MAGLRLRARVSARFYLALPHCVSVSENRIVLVLGVLVLRIEDSYYSAYCFRIISYTNKKSVRMQGATSQGYIADPLGRFSTTRPEVKMPACWNADLSAAVF